MNNSRSTEQEALDFVTDKLIWMRSRNIWPNGLRYLWTDAFGVVLLVSLFEKLNDYFETYRSGDEYDTAAITHANGV